MAVDSQRISDATFYLHNLWSAPVNIIGEMNIFWLAYKIIFFLEIS